MIRTILKDLGINSEKVNVDWSPAKLTEYAVKAGEGVLTNTGSLMCKTGKYTGRSPQNPQGARERELEQPPEPTHRRRYLRAPL